MTYYLATLLITDMNVPRLLYAENFKPEGLYSCNQISPDGKRWYFARGLGFQGLYPFRRLQLAWAVFTGKYDALEWEQQ